MRDALEDVDWSTKWVFRNKLDENGEVTRNKTILVCKGYAQEDIIDYVETFTHVTRLEGVRTLLSYSTYKGFKVIKWMWSQHFWMVY